jgi:hypothetical protein
VKLGEDLDAGLVVVGSRGLGGLRRSLIGSVSDSVVRHAQGSVLVVRGQEQAERRESTEASRAYLCKPVAKLSTTLTRIVVALSRKGPPLSFYPPPHRALRRPESLTQQGADDERYGRGGTAGQQRLQARAQR